MTSDKYPRLAIWLIPALLSIVALAKLPYGYYQFLRIVVFVSSIYLAYIEFNLTVSKINAWVVIFGLLAILFNPLIPIHLKRGSWALFNIICAVIFIAHMITKIKNPKGVFDE